MDQYYMKQSFIGFVPSYSEVFFSAKTSDMKRCSLVPKASKANEGDFLFLY